MKKHILPFLAGATLMMAACTADTADPAVARPETDGTPAEVAFTAKNFIPADANLARTAITGNSFAWVQQTDTIGILPDEGAQVYFVIKDLDEDASTATFTGQAWGLKKDNEYTAYYPFVGDIYLKPTAVPVDYSVQHYKHHTNDQGDVVVYPSHDYMAARATKTADGESLDFRFSHLGALVNVSFTMPEAAAVKRFYLCADQPVFPVKGTFDLTAESVAITPDDATSAYTVMVDVEDLETTASGQTVSVSFMMPPMSLEGLDLKATVTYGDDNTSLPMTVSLTRPDAGDGDYTQFEAGKSYTLQAAADESLPESFGVSQNSLSPFLDNTLSAKGGTKLRFVTDSHLTSETFIVDEDATDAAEVRAYAVRNGDWLELHTSAPTIKLLANANAEDVSASMLFCGSYYPHFASLQEIDLSGIDFSGVTDMTYMFFGCSALTAITFGSDFDTSAVTDMENMFDSCVSLTSLDLSSFNTSNVTDMNYMFNNCFSLTSLNLSGFNTSKVEDMRYMFCYCSSLPSLDVSHFDTSNVTNMNFMFDNCTSLTSLDVSNFNTSNVTDMSYMFNYCESLTSLDLSGFNTENVTDMSCMFSYCSSLTSLNLSGFDTSAVTDMYRMFDSCLSLTGLDLKSFTFDANPSCEDMFEGAGLYSHGNPIAIYVTSDGKAYLENQETGIKGDFAQLVVSTENPE